VALAWWKMLDGHNLLQSIDWVQAGGTGSNAKAPGFVLCAQVQASLFAAETGRMRHEQQHDEARELDPQALGMANAANREMVRRSARLLHHFGFQHFATPSKRGSRSAVTSQLQQHEQSAIEQVSREQREVVAVDAKGKLVDDVTHAKGDWGLRWK